MNSTPRRMRFRAVRSLLPVALLCACASTDASVIADGAPRSPKAHPTPETAKAPAIQVQYLEIVTPN